MSFTVETLLGFKNSSIVNCDSAGVVTLGHMYQVGTSNDNNKGVRISARNKPITIYGQNYNSFTTDAFLALPCTRQNVEEYVYYGITFHGESLYVGSSQLLIVGCEDNTTVTVASQTITLNMMETYIMREIRI